MYKISFYGSFNLFWMSSSKLKTFQSPCIQMVSHILKKLLREGGGGQYVVDREK